MNDVICAFMTLLGCARYDIERKRDMACHRVGRSLGRAVDKRGVSAPM